MKCIRCGTDSKYKARTGKVCPKCQGAFAFEPKDGNPYTDAAFENAIAAVSAQGQIRWGAEHLYYELARRRGKKTGCALVGFGIFVIAAVVTLAKSAYLVAILCGGIAGACALSYQRAREQRCATLTTRDFTTLLALWRKAHGTPKGLIERAAARGALAAPRALEADIADYSFDRAVICDRARTVDILLANNFHFENNCAVLSIDGYPEAQFETVRAMLKRNPRLQVFALHDATPNGCRLAHQLATDKAWFAGQAKVTDVGLRPKQAGAFAGLYQPHAGQAVRAGDGISAAEATWLSEYALELAVIRPEQVLKRLYKAMHRKDERDDDSAGGSGSTTEYDSESFTYEASDIDSDSDGFG